MMTVAVVSALSAKNAGARAELLKQYTPEEQALRQKSMDLHHADQCTEAEAREAAQSRLQSDLEDAAREDERDLARLRRSQSAAMVVHWAPVRFARWVKSVVRSIRITKWKLLNRMAGSDPRWSKR